MADSKQSQIWVAIVAGVAVFAAATWIMRDDSPDRLENPPHETVETAAQAELDAGVARIDGSIRIPDHGRLSLDLDALPEEGPLALVLDLPDEARGEDPHTLRVVSTDGRRLDTTASALAGAGTGVQLEIDSAFLTRGRYLIEIDTTEKTALQIRRYVLELK
jgi:hypothetical protein